MAVTNQQILDALIDLGIGPATVSAINVRGAQSSTFRSSVMRALGGGQRGADKVFDRAKEVAAWRPDPKRSEAANLRLALGVRGIAWQDQIPAIEARANERFRSRSGVSRPGQRFTDQDLLDATVDVLGASPAVASAFRVSGVKYQPPALAQVVAAPAAGPRPSAPGPRADPKTLVTRPTATERGLRPSGPGAPGTPGSKGPPAGTQLSPGDVAGDGTTTAVATGVTDATPALGVNATEDQVRAYVNEHYPQWAYLYDVPELKDKVIRPAVTEGWDADRVLGAMYTTTWWQKTESSARLWKESKYQDPAEAADKVNKKYTVFANLARAKGITVPEKELRDMAEDSIEFDWDDNETTAAMGRFFHYDPNKLMGEAADTAVKMRQLHKAYLIPLSDATVQTWTEKVMQGKATTDDFEDYLRVQAKTMFPMLATQIDLDVTPDQWVDPYRQIAAQTLGVSPDAIDFRDSKWMSALDEFDPKTNQRRPMYLSDWTNKLKTDDQFAWDETAQGRAHGAQLAASLSKTFGRG